VKTPNVKTTVCETEGRDLVLVVSRAPRLARVARAKRLLGAVSRLTACRLPACRLPTG
jgi:hypothetical protein